MKIRREMGRNVRTVILEQEKMKRRKEKKRRGRNREERNRSGEKINRGEIVMDIITSEMIGEV